MKKTLDKAPSRPIPVDDNVKIMGLKNPVYLVIVGFSTRAVLDSARKSGKQIKAVLIIEPDLRVFKATLERELVTDIINDPEVDIITGIPPQELHWHIFKAFSQTTKAGPRASKCQGIEIVNDVFVYGEPSTKEYTDEIGRIALDASKQVGLSMGCASDTFFRWEQSFRNIENIKTSFQVKSLFNKFKDVPAIVVGGGPSVEEFIQAYKDHDLKDKALIISCDASLPRLLKEGIRPHIVTRCERKFTTIFGDLKREDTKDIYYAAYPWTPPEFFDLFEDKIMLFRGNGIGHWMTYEPGCIDGGVSSANAAIEMAFQLGVKHIWITGIDLCFLDGKSHVAGTEVEFDLEKSKPKWTEIEANDGSKVTTIPVWQRCLKEYIHGFAKHANLGIPVYNASLKGAKIFGAQPMPWTEAPSWFKEKHEVLSLIRNNLTKHTPEYETKFNSRKEESLKLLKSAKHDLKKIFLFVDDAMLQNSREEQRSVAQIKGHTDPREFFHNTKQVKDGLVGIYEPPIKQIDDFKKKYFVNPLFNFLVLDLCMSELFTTENKCHGLDNVIELKHEVSKSYIALNVVLYRLFDTYIDKMIELIEFGPVEYTYEPEPEYLDPFIEDEALPKGKSNLILPSQYKKNKNAGKGLMI